MLFVCSRCQQSMELPSAVSEAECPACGGSLVAGQGAPLSGDAAYARTRAEPHVTRGLAASRSGDHGRAVREFTLAIQIDPTDPRTLNNRGFAYSACRDYGRAVADFDAA